MGLRWASVKKLRSLYIHVLVCVFVCRRKFNRIHELNWLSDMNNSRQHCKFLVYLSIYLSMYIWNRSDLYWYDLFISICWRSKNKLISDVLLWTPLHEQTWVGWLAKNYIHQFQVHIGCRLDDLARMIPVGTNGERDKGIHAISTPWWWWWWWSISLFSYLSILICPYQHIYIIYSELSFYHMSLLYN